MENPSGKMDEKARVQFKKEERLCSKILIDKLFTEGTSFLVYPFKVVYLDFDFPGDFPAKAVFAVSKKLFKKAVSRNLIKRRTREAYRLNKNMLTSDNTYSKKAVIFIYIGKEILQFSSIEKAMIRIFERLKKASIQNP
jgi:ribonuclease P protein component